MVQNLKKLRMNRKLSQQALAEQFNLTQQSIYKYENGLAEPDIEMIKNLAVYFGVSIDYLLGNSDTSSVADTFITIQPTEREINLIHKFRFLETDVQDSVELLIEKLTACHK